MKYVIECEVGETRQRREYDDEATARYDLRQLRMVGAVYIRVAEVKDVTHSFLHVTIKEED